MKWPWRRRKPKDIDEGYEAHDLRTPAFNVGDEVMFEGAGPIPAQRDAVRRALPSPFRVPSGARGVVRAFDIPVGVSTDDRLVETKEDFLVFVAFEVEVPKDTDDWRRKADFVGAEFQKGERIKAKTEIDTVMGYLPKGQPAVVTQATSPAADRMLVSTTMMFKARDLINKVPKDLRHWGRRKGDEKARGQLDWQGLTVCFEYFSGEVRASNKHHDRPLTANYGYFDNITAQDGDSLDVVWNPDIEDPNGQLFIVEQTRPGEEEVHQYKVFIGFNDEEEVKLTFENMWEESMLGDIHPCSVEAFKNDWLPELEC